MKWFIITVMMAGSAGAADFTGLQKMDAAAVAAQTGGWQQIPGFHPAHPFPMPPATPPEYALDTCVNTGVEDGKCVFKCKLGGVMKEEPVRPGVCATHIFRPVPAQWGAKGLKTMEDWESVDLLADDGTVVSLDYVPADLGGKVKATRVWVSVRNDGFTGGEAVSARLTNYYEATAHSAETPREVTEISLPYNGWSFQAKFPDLSIFEAHHAWSHSFRQEVAVFVNGRRLTDGSGREAFQLKLPGKPAWAEQSEKSHADKAIRACSFREVKGDACSYSCSDGSSYTRPVKLQGPFGDEPVVPCPAVVFPF